MLLVGTWLFRRQRVAAIELLETEVLGLAGVRLRLHRFGGVEFAEQARQLAHIHGNGLLDVFLRSDLAETLITAGRVRRHHVFPRSRWVSFQLESKSDVPFALELLEIARTKENQILDAAKSQD